MTPSNILFIAEGQLGDLLLLTPALRAMKISYPSATISVLAVERRMERRCSLSGELIQHLVSDDATSPLARNPNVDNAYLVNRDRLRSLHGLARVKAEFKVVKCLRSKRFDTVICTFPEDRFALWAFASAARVRVGQKDQALHWLLTMKPKTSKKNRNVLEYYCDLVAAAGARVDTKETEFIIPDSSVKWADAFLHHHGLEGARRIVAVHPGATGNYKIWPVERYAALIDAIQQDEDGKVILCQGSGDQPLANDVSRLLRTEVATAETGDNVANFAALLKRCSLLISNDSGPRHLAAAVGTPTLAFMRQYHDYDWKIYPEDDHHATLQGKETCPACPTSACLDKIPTGERYGSYCLRMVSIEQTVTRVRQLISR